MLRYDAIKKSVHKVIIHLIKNARGTAVTFRPVQLARKAGLPVSPAICSVIRYYLENELGLPCISKNGHGYRYIVNKYQHPDLWNLAKNS